MTLINNFTQINNGVVSTNNSTLTLLAGGAAFTGTLDDVAEYASIIVSVYSSHASATNGLSLQFRIDGTWRESDAYTIPATTLKTYTVQPVANEFRVVYTNGATLQTTFELQTQYKKSGGVAHSHRVADDISGQDDAGMVKAVLVAERPSPAGVYTNINATNGGNLKVSVEEIDPAAYMLVKVADGANLDPFSRLRVSNPVGQLDAQFTYDLQPLVFEQITNGTGATVTHDSTNRMALMTFASTPTGGQAEMQSYEWFRYQAGRGQLPIITFNFNSGVANVIKFAEYGDGSNAYGFRMNGTTPQFYILSDTDNGDQVKDQADWNLDKLNGSGASGLTFAADQEQILVIDFQALYVGRVRMGLDIGGQIVYCHEFLHANATTKPYIQLASLPVHVGMTCTATVSTTMWFNCSTVISEGGEQNIGGIPLFAEGTGTAGSSAWAHILSVRPKTTFNSIANRSRFALESVECIVTGNNPIILQIGVGQAITGTTTYTDANTTYSAFEYNTAGTISGTPALGSRQFYIGTGSATKLATSQIFAQKLPITLNAAGAVRSLGTLSAIAYGIGGTSACRVTFNWLEVR